MHAACMMHLDKFGTVVKMTDVDAIDETLKDALEPETDVESQKIAKRQEL